MSRHVHVIFILSIFFFKQKTAYEMRISDWSSDVCSSDLDDGPEAAGGIVAEDDLLVAVEFLVLENRHDTLWQGPRSRSLFSCPTLKPRLPHSNLQQEHPAGSKIDRTIKAERQFQFGTGAWSLFPGKFLAGRD